MLLLAEVADVPPWVTGGGAAIVAAAIWGVAHKLAQIWAVVLVQLSKWEAREAARDAETTKHRKREEQHYRRVERHHFAHATYLQALYMQKHPGKRLPDFDDTQPIPDGVIQRLRHIAAIGDEND